MMSDHGQEHSEAEYSARETHEDAAQPPSPMSPALTGFQPPPSPPGHDVAEAEPAEPNWRRHFTRENFKIALEVVGLGVLIVYTAFAGCQWKVANDTLIEIRNGKADTTRIITASETQATAAQKIADASGRNANAAGKSADAAAKFADRADSISRSTKSAVDQFKILAESSRNSITAAQTAAADALKASNRALNVQTRPWLDLTITGVSGSKIVDKRNFSTSVSYAVHNYGSSPALRLDVTFRHVTEMGPPHFELEAVCPLGPYNENLEDKITNALFPGGQQSGTKTMGQQNLFGYRYNAVGCVYYRDNSSSDVHITTVRFSFTADRGEDGTATMGNLMVHYIDAK